MSRLGSGGMGAVYEVLDEKSQTPRALKLMAPGLWHDDDARARFQLEASIPLQCSDRRLVKVHSTGVDSASDCPFLVMDLAPGLSLAECLRLWGPFPPRLALHLLREIAAALEAVHHIGVVHRDLNPNNVLLVSEGNAQLSVRLIDFGIAKLVRQAPAHTTLNLGTPHYMAPEQMLGHAHIGPEADFYSLGQLAFTLLVGRPYWAESAEGLSLYQLLHQVSQGANTSPRSLAGKEGITLPPAFDDWFQHVTHPEPEERPLTALECVSALEQSLPRAFWQEDFEALSFLKRSTNTLNDRKRALQAAFSPPNPAARRTGALSPAKGLAGASLIAVALFTLGAFSSPFQAHESQPNQLTENKQQETQTSSAQTLKPAPPAQPEAPTQALSSPPRPHKAVISSSASWATTPPKKHVSRTACEVPYVFDRDGIKRFRSACLAPPLHASSHSEP